MTTWGSVKGFDVPAATPPRVIEYLASTLKKVWEDAEFKKNMAAVYQPIMYQNSKDFTAFMRKAYNDYGDLIKKLDLNI